MKNLFLLIILILLLSCGKQEIQIADNSGSKVGNYAITELQKYLNEMYSGVEFKKAHDSDADIRYLLSEQAKEMGLIDLPTQKESFQIIQKEEKILVISPDERGLLNATYALLEKLGCGFYLSEDVMPEQKKWPGFDEWKIKDAPVTGDRFIFNWHNFLSGCTGWNLPDWQKWIDQINKMRYNGIMVHAYGNNPMFGFKYLGEQKQTGYLNNTASGRDWGNQHINDVRRLVGGEIFEGPVFGAEASFASEENKDEEATKLMQQVFKYAEDRGTKIIFALDFDTWMSIPENIMAKLPKEALLQPYVGQNVINPDHPLGYSFYETLLTALLKMYPEIDQLAVWHRRPDNKKSGWSPWMSFQYEQFPEGWKKEYKEKLKQNPQLEDNLKSSSMFAYGKVVSAIQKARDVIKPELEISAGSWRFDFVKYADVMYPQDVPLLPLDWEVVFDSPESIGILSDAGGNRKIYPIIWAHHDDHRYIGRPYTPWDNLSERLRETNSKGFGIIHWTTHPLDLYFTSSARQVWESSENESLKNTVASYVSKKFESDHEKLTEYYYEWVTNGPMFGRETSDHFVDLGVQKLGHGLESWEEMSQKTIERIVMLDFIESVEKNKYLKYQKAMEEFYLSFFENQAKFRDAFLLTREGNIEKAKEIIQTANPDESIQKYTDAIKIIGFTSGEKALVFSMNTRWKADFINLRQRLGVDPVRFKFSPTQHDPLAQGPGRFTYFIDHEKNWWRCLWKHELKNGTFNTIGEKTFLQVDGDFVFELKTIHGQKLPDGHYEMEIFLQEENQKVMVEVLENETPIFKGSQNKINFKNGAENLRIKVTSISAKVGLTGISITKK